MKEKLVIEGNAVYKMDPDCLLKKEREREMEREKGKTVSERCKKKKRIVGPYSDKNQRSR